MLQNEDIKTTIEKLYTIRAIISMLSIEIEKAYNSEQKFFTKEKAIYHAYEWEECRIHPSVEIPEEWYKEN